ncbi:MAG: efflux RND transporter periplasmic adaptor subunit [Betaproteobacteria bacterium]|nr:MAG: efflux RND transporter periplasmic adaptor subunit [Betaproteobacteria bacterium]
MTGWLDAAGWITRCGDQQSTGIDADQAQAHHPPRCSDRADRRDGPGRVLQEGIAGFPAERAPCDSGHGGGGHQQDHASAPLRDRQCRAIHDRRAVFEIDPRGFAAALKQAQANLAKDKALLDRAVEQEKRYKDLLGKNFISPDAYEQVRTNMETAAATVRADEAGIENARLSLEYCTIRAPVTGYAGRIQIQQGNLVKANDTNPLVTINQVVPIYTTFSVPEQSLADIRKYQTDGELKVQAAFANSTRAPISGKLSFIDNTADATTGTIRLKAEFANTDKALWPGQFVNVVLTLYEQKDAIVTPSAAIQSGPSGQYVYVVKPDQTVELRTIKVARSEGDDTVIASGLQAGEQVVTVGQLRLAPGSRVNVGKSAQAS